MAGRLILIHDSFRWDTSVDLRLACVPTPKHDFIFAIATPPRVKTQEWEESMLQKTLAITSTQRVPAFFANQLLISRYLYPGDCHTPHPKSDQARIVANSRAIPVRRHLPRERHAD
jgi:hypothetical protein